MFRYILSNTYFSDGYPQNINTGVPNSKHFQNMFPSTNFKTVYKYLQIHNYVKMHIPSHLEPQKKKKTISEWYTTKGKAVIQATSHDKGYKTCISNHKNDAGPVRESGSGTFGTSTMSASVSSSALMTWRWLSVGVMEFLICRSGWRYRIRTYNPNGRATCTHVTNSFQTSIFENNCNWLLTCQGKYNLAV